MINLADILFKLNADKYSGSIDYQNGRFDFLISGPFNHGFAIQCSWQSGAGTAFLHWDWHDGGEADVTLFDQTYYANEHQIRSVDGRIMAKIDGNDNITASQDTLLLSLLIVFRWYSLKKGPWLRVTFNQPHNGG